MLEKIKETYVDCNFVKGNVWQQYKRRKKINTGKYHISRFDDIRVHQNIKRYFNMCTFYYNVP